MLRNTAASIINKKEPALQNPEGEFIYFEGEECLVEAERTT
jgi:hypothetical protein